MFNQGFNESYFNDLSKSHYPGFLGISIKTVEEGRLIAEMPITKNLFAPNGFLHAGSIVSLADTVAGYAVLAHLPEKGKSFTTLELKSNFIRAAREGILECEAIVEHLGRTTQVWRAVVRAKETKKKVAVFSCTQLILY